MDKGDFYMDSKRIKALLMAGVTLFVSGCSAVSESGYLGYKKNELKFGEGVTRQFQQAVARANIEWLDEILTEYQFLQIVNFATLVEIYKKERC